MENRERESSAPPPDGSRASSADITPANSFWRVARSELLICCVAALLLALAAWVAGRQVPTSDSFAPVPAWTTLAWWKAPMGRNAFLRLPSISADLTDVHFAADGQRGWVVGFGGTILSTRDGGASWQPQASGTQARLFSMHFADDGQRGWVVGGDLTGDGTILSTRDGGASWQPQASGTQAVLRSVHFADDGQRGWVVGGDGTILSTRDGGTSWQPQARGTKTFLSSVRFADDGQRGWIVGGDGTILSTRDGGTSWQPQASGTQAALYSVRFADDGQRGWVVGSKGSILSTRDGGASWQPQTSGTQALLISVHFADDGRRGWVVGDDGTILSTRDGGASWQPQTSGTQAVLPSVHFADDGQRGWVVRDDGTILSTRDGGASWQPQTSGTKTFLSSVRFADDGQRGWIVGGDGTILSTRDGGTSWQPQASGTQAGLRSVHFADDGQRGWVVGSKGSILSTRDGGASWQPQTSGTQAGLRSVHFADDGQRGWVVGSKGSILSTRDGGASWQPQASGTQAALYSVHFADDGRRGWVVGDDGTILSTRDGGASWQPQASGTQAALLYSVRFADDGQHGWVVGWNLTGGNGTILSTRDGGASWQPQASGIKAFLSSVHFADDGQRGWVVGSKGSILSTRDGGASWQPQTSGTKTFLSSVRFADDGQRGWVVGSKGTILSTRNGGTTWHAATYSSYPAPWFWATFAIVLLSATWLCIVNNDRPGIRLLSITGKGHSDEPVFSAEQDRLNFSPIVNGLAGYLRNSETKPPLTIAINAHWGQGKSSFMRMLQQCMASHGVCSVWFNAWHHQKEEVLLAALLQAIREQALPPLLSWPGLRFRARLLWRRLCAHPWIGMLGLAGFAFPLYHLVADFIVWLSAPHNAGNGVIAYLLETWQGMLLAKDGGASLKSALNGSGVLDWLWAELKHASAHPDTLLDALSFVLFLVLSFLLMQYGLRAFPGSPAVLLASLSQGARLTGLDDQTSYREKFKQHYRDVCASLAPRFPLLFIDDLDRCDLGKTAEMLEAVNYLSNSGQCFIVLGMARDIVEAQLAIHYHGLATEHAKVVESDEQGTHPELRYVRSYLRKLVNLDIRLPALSAEGIRTLLDLEKQKADSTGPWAKRHEAIQRAWSVWMAPTARWLLVGGMVLWLTTSLSDSLDAWKKERDEVTKADMNEIEDIEKRLVVQVRRLQATLDIARGRSEQAAAEVFKHTGIALPSEYARLSADVRKSIDAKAPGSNSASNADPCTPAGKPIAAASTSEARTKKSRTSPPSTDPVKVLECWRHRESMRMEIEEELKELREKLNAKAGKGSAYRLEELKTADASLADILAGVEKETGLVRPAAQSDPTASTALTSERERPQEENPVLIAHDDKDAIPLHWWALAPMALIGALFTLRRGRFVIKDKEQFKKALEIWHPLLAMGDDLATPREIRRFENRARYYAMRLRPHSPEQKCWLRAAAEWLDRRRSQEPKSSLPDAGTSIPEELIVGLTAIRHVAPEHLKASTIWPRESGEEEPRLLRAVNMFMARHNQTSSEINRSTTQSEEVEKFESWPIDEARLAVFLEVAGEFNVHKNAASEPSKRP